MASYKVSNLKLYYTIPSSALWELLPQKLFIIDSIEDYLADKSNIPLSNIQYIKNALEIDITLDLSQTYAEPLNTSIKYVRIENSDQTGKYYYYFVKNVEWRSKSAVKLSLLMDVLNTFKEGTHYNFKANTRIIREHKDRYIRRNYSVVFTIISADLIGTMPAVNSEVYITDINNLNDKVYIGTLTADSYPTLTIKFTDIDIEELEEWLGVKQEALNRICFCTDINNYLEAGLGTTVSVSSYSSEYFRNIDYVNENINPALQCGNAEGRLIESNKSLLEGDWYLLYRNQNTPDDKATVNTLVNPVECYLIADEDKAVSIGAITSGQILPKNLENGKLYYIPLYQSVSYITDIGYLQTYNQSITLSNGIVLGGTAYTNGMSYVVIGKDSNGTLSVCYNKMKAPVSPSPNFEILEQIIYGGITSITINQNPTYYYASSESGIDYVDLYKDHFDTDERQQFTYNATGKNINSIDILDRTDPKNIKLFKLPYCPYDFAITSSKIDVANSDWNFTELQQADGSYINCLQLYDLNTDLHSTLTLSINAKNPLIALKQSLSISITDTRKGANYETKLFHSEFYKPVYVYDSFSYVVELEKLNIDSYISSRTLTVYFDMTKTINSRFMFTFDSLVFKYSAESYNKYLPIARNNEEVLYNVPYINYIRTGYNYDVKNKNLSNASNWIGAGLSLAGAVASLSMPTAPLKALGIASSLISMAMTTKNAIVQTVQNEQSIQRKLNDVKNQTASVSGSDDVDLMSIYAENRLKYLIYEPNPVMKNMLYDLFYYAGYNSNRLGKPNHNTRVNFDYLEADVELEKIANIPNDCLNELINAFKNGVSYIHKTSRVSNKWDIKQELENWEVSLL